MQRSIKRGPRPRIEFTGCKRLRPGAVPSLHVDQSARLPAANTSQPGPCVDPAGVVDSAFVSPVRQKHLTVPGPRPIVSRLQSDPAGTPSGNLETRTGTLATPPGNLAMPSGDLATTSGNLATSSGNLATTSGNLATRPTLPYALQVDDKLRMDKQTYSYFVVKTTQPNLPIPKHLKMVGKIDSSTILEPQRPLAEKRSVLGFVDDLFIKLESVGEAESSEKDETVQDPVADPEIEEDAVTNAGDFTEEGVPGPDDVRIIYPLSILRPPPIPLTVPATDNGVSRTVSEALSAVLKPYEPDPDAGSLSRDHTYAQPPQIVPNHVCGVCGQGYTTLVDFSIHALRHLNQKCKFCGLLLDTFKKFHAHLPSLSEDLECEICKKVLSCMGRLKQHEKAHGEAVLAKPSFRCGLCDMVFFKVGNYTRHYASHKRNVSRKHYTYRELSVSHKDSASHEDSACHVDSASREDHAYAFHQKASAIASVIDRRKGFRCGRCPISFASRAERRTHLELVHSLSSVMATAKRIVRRSKKTARKRQYEENENEDSQCKSGTIELSNRTAEISDDLGKELESAEKPKPKRVRKREPTKVVQCDENSQIPKPRNGRKREQAQQCETCGKTFKPKTLIDHIKHVHENKRDILCTTCGSRFNLESQLKSHMRLVHPDTNVVCELCGLKLKNLASLRAHRKIHEEGKAFTCETCGVSYRRKAVLMRHQLVHTGEPGAYSCELCGRDFKTGTELRRHLRFKHLPGEEPAARVECPTCGKSFAEKYLPFHRRRVHRSRVENFGICEFCCKKSKSKTAFDRHRRTHTGEKPYVCNVCYKRFAAQAGLQIHQRIHTGEKPYVCDVCHKGFTQLGALKGHKRVHTGERPFPCPRCVKRFKLRNHLRAHLEYHDRVAGKIRKCDAEKTSFTVAYPEGEAETIDTIEIYTS